MIGSGIFVSPAFALQYSGSVGMCLVVWTVCGIVSLLGTNSKKKKLEKQLHCNNFLRGTRIRRTRHSYTTFRGRIRLFLRFIWPTAQILGPFAGIYLFMGDDRHNTARRSGRYCVNIFRILMSTDIRCTLYQRC